ncbi:MAG: DUF3566 domain-containing protein [Microthrixaceae bacterium]
MTATSSRELRDEPGPDSPSGAPGQEAEAEQDRGPRRVLGYQRQRYEARKVRRLVRHIDPWSILKLALLMMLCLWVVGLIASVVVWSVANSTGALDSLERFFNESLQLEDFELSGDVLFRQFGLISLLIALGTTATIVVATLVFNLISDIIGGVWVSVIEEESARPVGGEEPDPRRSP